MKTVKVTASGNYPIYVSAGLLDKLGSFVKESLPKAEKIYIITDQRVGPLYENKVRDQLVAAGFVVESTAIVSGEQSKNGVQYLELLEKLSQAQITRSDAILALGGGVVGDLAGFLAATYLRGIAYVQVPTSLLAMVDSSVGGKVAINLVAGKNLAGAFYQPSLVLCDIDSLQTLPQAVLADGMAEIIKYGMIDSEKLLNQLTNGVQTGDMEEIIAQCVSMKRDIVQEDERDLAGRQILNFGHTVGHAIEKLENYEISHGSAVAIGMLIETKAAVKMGKYPEACLEKLRALLIKYHLPQVQNHSPQALYQAALGDKKRAGDSITVVTPRAFGKCELYTMKVEELLNWITMGVQT